MLISLWSIRTDALIIQIMKAKANERDRDKHIENLLVLDKETARRISQLTVNSS